MRSSRRRGEGICAASPTSTIVVLRSGRRFRPKRADVAQLVAHHLAKVRVAGSNPVIRSKVQVRHQTQRWSGRVVRQRPAKPCTRVRFPSPPPRDWSRAISSAGERFPDTEEVTGSIPVSRTTIDAMCSCSLPGTLKSGDRSGPRRSPPHPGPQRQGNCFRYCAAESSRTATEKSMRSSRR